MKPAIWAAVMDYVSTWIAGKGKGGVADIGHFIFLP